MTVQSDRAADLRDTLDALWRKLRSSQSASANSSMKTAEIFIDLACGRPRAAIDNSGARHLLVPVTGATAVPPGASGSGLGLRVRELVSGDEASRYIDLECKRRDLTDAFTGLVADICTRLATVGGEPAPTMLATLDEWRSLLGMARGSWTPASLAGVAGELIMLREVLELDPGAVGLWTGPSGLAHDFHSVHHALEVKTSIRPSGRLVRIHGIDQLEPPVTGKLHLAWLRLAHSRSGSTVPQLIDECAGRSTSRDAFLRSVDLLGLPPRDDQLMSDVCFEEIERRCYVVDTWFPRIAPGAFEGGAVPGGVTAVEYTIDLDTVAGPHDAFPSVLQELVSDR